MVPPLHHRYKSIVNELLRERTVASREGAVEYLATSAALQQFKQTALAYLLLEQAAVWQGEEVPGGREGWWREEELAVAVERLLAKELGLQVRAGWGMDNERV